MSEERIILADSPEAAEYRTVTGWVSRHGHFFGEAEGAARYNGSTHQKCDCGEIIAKNSYCRLCSDKHRIDKYSIQQFKEWDETTPVYSDSADRYFYSPEEIDDYLSDHDDVTASELHLIICKRITLPTVDDDYFMDNAPDGYELEDMVSEDFMEALIELNTLAECEDVNAWEPGEFRTEYTRYVSTEGE